MYYKIHEMISPFVPYSISLLAITESFMYVYNYRDAINCTYTFYIDNYNNYVVPA